MFFCNKPRNGKAEQPAKEEKMSCWRKIFKKRSDGKSLKKDNDNDNDNNDNDNNDNDNNDNDNDDNDNDDNDNAAEKPTERKLKTFYTVGMQIGSGGYGSVYEGKRRADGLEVAVKFVKKFAGLQYITIPNHPVPVPKEVALLILANEEPKVPEIISFIDWFEEPLGYIIVMEHPPNYKAMSELVYSWSCKMKEEEARHILKQVVKTALICSERGIFHRDIKLENLLMNKDDMKVKLIDFGAGDLLRTNPYETFTGTEPYCPPEFRRNGSYWADPATVFSLGVLLFRMVYGRFPTEVDHWRVLYQNRYRKGLSAECCHLIKSCLQRKPDSRLKLEEILKHPWFQESHSE